MAHPSDQNQRIKLEANRQLGQLLNALTSGKIKGEITLRVTGENGKLKRIATNIANYINPEDI